MCPFVKLTPDWLYPKTYPTQKFNKKNTGTEDKSNFVGLFQTIVMLRNKMGFFNRFLLH